MAQADRQEKPEQGYTLDCWHGHLVNEPIKEYHPKTKTIETIGHLWFCLRRFKEVFRGDHTKLSPAELLRYQHPDCPFCHRENTAWVKHITVDFTKTKFSKETIRNWITGELKRGAKTFLLNAEAIHTNGSLAVINKRVMERPERPDVVPHPVGNYNPDQFTEQEDVPL